MSEMVPMYGFGGSGGGGLNFKVVGGTTQPTNPTENTIWVNTSVSITDWVFSATQPTNPADGMVWIQTSTTSDVEFNALKKNGIQVYPISAKQFVGGEWVHVTAMSYQGGEWVEWIRQIPMTAENFISVVGFPNQQYTIVTGTFEDGIYSVYLPAKLGSGTLSTIEKIDVTNINTIKMKLYISDNMGANGDFRLSLEPSQYFQNKVAYVSCGTYYDDYICLDVSKVTGEYYVVFGTNVWNTSGITAKYSEFTFF